MWKDLARTLEDWPELRQQALNTQEWINRVGFQSIMVTSRDPLIRWLCQEYQGNERILLMEPDSFYNWHRDHTRRVSINVLLEGFQGHCWFGQPKGMGYHRLNEVIYLQGGMVMLDVSQQHAVWNGSTTRLVYSLSLYKGIDFKGLDSVLAGIQG